MLRFIVFDVETPNRYNNRMSAMLLWVIAFQNAMALFLYKSLIKLLTS